MRKYRYLKIIALVIVIVLSSCEGRKFIDIPTQKVEQEIFDELQARQTLERLILLIDIYIKNHMIMETLFIV